MPGDPSMGFGMVHGLVVRKLKSTSPEEPAILHSAIECPAALTECPWLSESDSADHRRSFRLDSRYRGLLNDRIVGTNLVCTFGNHAVDHPESRGSNHKCRARARLE